MSGSASCRGTISLSRGKNRQRSRISAVDSRNGGSMMDRNSPLGML